jgi:hypothetical protein
MDDMNGEHLRTLIATRGSNLIDDIFQILVPGSPKAEILGNVFGGQGKSLVDFLDID